MLRRFTFATHIRPDSDAWRMVARKVIHPKPGSQINGSSVLRLGSLCLVALKKTKREPSIFGVPPF